jgi:hypothetical protein
VNGYKAIYKTSAGFFEQLEEVPPAARLRIDASGTESLTGIGSRASIPAKA